MATSFSKLANDISYAMQTGSPELKKYADLLGVTTDQFKSMSGSDAMIGIVENLTKQGPDAIRTLEKLGLEGQRTMRAWQAVSQTGGLRESIDAAYAAGHIQGAKS